MVDLTEEALLAVGEEGGFCENCQPGGKDQHAWPFRKLYRHPNARERTLWPGRYCHNCLLRAQRYLPTSECFPFCWQCQTFVAWDQVLHDMSSGPARSIVIGDFDGWCFACIEKAKITCAVCGKRTLEHNHGDRCWDCEMRDPALTQLSLHLERARARGAPATLTAEEWLAAVKYFKYKCAYCGKRPFQVLEHYLPIHLGGGTSRENCLPACTRCNGAKKARHPDEFVKIFSAQRLAAIQAYFAQQ